MNNSAINFAARAARHLVLTARSEIGLAPLQSLFLTPVCRCLYVRLIASLRPLERLINAKYSARCGAAKALLTSSLQYYSD